MFIFCILENAVKLLSRPVIRLYSTTFSYRYSYQVLTDSTSIFRLYLCVALLEITQARQI